MAKNVLDFRGLEGKGTSGHARDNFWDMICDIFPKRDIRDITLKGCPIVPKMSGVLFG